MLKIHAKQLAACAEVSAQSFTDRLTQHLVEALPAQAAALGAPAIRAAVEKGIASAASFGITGRQDVCLFLAASSALSKSFGAAPDLSRVAAVLGPDNPLDAASKARQMWSVVRAEVLPDEAEESAEDSDAPASVAIAMELAEAAHTALAGPLPVARAVAPCPLRPRTYPFSL